MTQTNANEPPPVNTEHSASNAVLSQLLAWDPHWAKSYMKVTEDSRTSGVLTQKIVELIRVALGAPWNNLNPERTRLNIRAALNAGATRDEVLLVLKMTSIMPINTCSMVLSILFEEATESDLDAAAQGRAKRLSDAKTTPTVDKMKFEGRWSKDWDTLYGFAPDWTDQFMEMATGVYESNVLSIKHIELLGIAISASYTHLDTASTRRHIRKALRAGATVDEIVAVLKLCILQGVEACNVGIPILAEEAIGH